MAAQQSSEMATLFAGLQQSIKEQNEAMVKMNHDNLQKSQGMLSETVKPDPSGPR